jgi:hypothetical protein
VELGLRPLVARLREVESAVKWSFATHGQKTLLHLEACSVVSRHQLQPGGRKPIPRSHASSRMSAAATSVSTNAAGVP